MHHETHEEPTMKPIKKRTFRFTAAAVAMTVAVWAYASTLSAANLQTTAKTLFGAVKPVTVAEVTEPQAVLGRALFWDKRLSLSGDLACASCHSAEDWSSDKRRLSINAKGLPTTMHSQAIFMSMDQTSLRWYGDRTSGAHQAERSLTGSMGFAAASDVLPLLTKFDYEAKFKAVFEGQAEPMTTANYAQAMQAYERTLRTPAAFDNFVNGDTAALKPQQLAGLNKFVSFGCAGCHSGALLCGNSNQKFGVTKDYWLATGSTERDTGRFNVTKKEEDKYMYRVPMLRNISKTAPYFHDGSVGKLEDAISVMGELQLGRKLTPQDTADIAAFFETLTGNVPAHYAAPK